jgi:inositol-pentakisphosphate 2-kinase
MEDQELHSNPSRCLEILCSVPLTLHYLTEGNANVIYSVASTAENHEAAQHDHCCVLRMRKDLSTTRPCIENLTAIRERITPLFGNEHQDALMPKVLYKLTPEMLQQANNILHELDAQSSNSGESKRALAKRDIFHPDLDREPHAILMPNMRHGDNALFREFKPKWLQQSPNAPPGSRRCRTCATNGFKRSQGKHGKGDSGFCPLDLLSSDRSMIQTVLQKIDPHHGSAANLVDGFLQQVQPVVHHLADLQAKHNTEGLQDPSNPEHRDYAVAMALRDCSVFLVLHASEAGRVEIARVKLADLDLKISTEGNLEKWAKMENELISSGAYTDESIPGSACALERRSA